MQTQQSSRKYGWIRPRNQHHHNNLFIGKKYNVNVPINKLPGFKDLKQLPINVDLSDHLIVFDQEQLGSCTSNVTANMYIKCFKKQIIGLSDTESEVEPTQLNKIPSRLFLYYLQRVETNTIKEDSGSSMDTAVMVLQTIGPCDEIFWPYKINKFARRPSKKAFVNSKNNKMTRIATNPQFMKKRINLDVNVLEFKIALALGHVIGFGMNAYESLENLGPDHTLVYNKDDKFLGGHAVLCVGYDDSRSCFRILNSWGTNYGDSGYFWLHYDLLEVLEVSDSWIIL